MKEKQENTVEEARMKESNRLSEAQDKMLKGVGASFIEEFRTNKDFRPAVVKAKGLTSRMKMLGLDIEGLIK